MEKKDYYLLNNKLSAVMGCAQLKKISDFTKLNWASKIRYVSAALNLRRSVCRMQWDNQDRTLAKSCFSLANIVNIELLRLRIAWTDQKYSEITDWESDEHDEHVTKQTQQTCSCNLGFILPRAPTDPPHFPGIGAHPASEQVLQKTPPCALLIISYTVVGRACVHTVQPYFPGPGLYTIKPT